MYKVVTCQHLSGIVISPNWRLENEEVDGMGEAGREASGLQHLSCAGARNPRSALKADWDCALVTGSPFVALPLGLSILFTISRLSADVIGVNNFNGVQCCFF